jgi:hypothetical protein
MASGKPLRRLERFGLVGRLRAQPRGGLLKCLPPAAVAACFAV